MPMKRLMSGLLACSMSLSIACAESERPSAGSLLRFDDNDRVVAASTRKAKDTQLDVWAGYLPIDTDIRTGLGIRVSTRKLMTRLSMDADKWIITGQIADGLIGAGLARKKVPVIDIAVGIGLLYRVDDTHIVPTIYGSLYRW